MANYCIVCSSDKENRPSPSSSFFKFPSSPNRRHKWLSVFSLNENSLKYRSRVCDLHFDRNQFVRTRLRKNAIPTNSMKKRQSVSPSGGRFPLVEILPKKDPVKQCLFPVQAPDVISITEDILNCSIQPLLVQPPLSDYLSLTPVQVPMIMSIIPEGSLNCSSQHNLVQPSPPNPVRSLDFCAVETPKPLTKHQKCRRRISNLSVELRKLHYENAKKTNIQDVFAKSPGFLRVIESQIKRYGSGPVPYDSFEKTLALSLYYSCGTNGYRSLLSMGFKLAAMSTLRTWMNSFKFFTGINETLFNCVKRATEGLKDKNCVLMWDEMSIKEFVEYNKHEDFFEGIVDFSHHGRNLQTANEVLVFMVHGIDSSWKYPISYYFSSHANTSDFLETLVVENINNLFQIDLQVRIGICDMSFTNQALYRKWEVSYVKPYNIVSEKKIYFIHDTPHLIKLVRNNLMKHDFVISKKKGNKLVDCKVRWMHIAEFFRKDRRTASRMAPKLTNGHIFLKDFAKMKVRLATQVFSTSVYAGIMTMCRLKIMKAEAKETAQFIRKIDELFDILNTSKFEHDKYGRCAKYFYQNIGKFDEFLEFLRLIRIPTLSREPEFLKGLSLTLSGIKSLALDLNHEGFTVIYTRRLQQDPLENFFSAIRMKGFFCKNPTARQFRLNFRYLFFAKLIKNPTSGNTEVVHEEFSKRIQNINKILPMFEPKQKEREVSLGENELIEDADFEKSQIYTAKANRKLKFGKEQEEEVALYIGAACVRAIVKLNGCKNCKNIFGTPSETHKSTLVAFKQFDSSSAALLGLDKQASVFFKSINKVFITFALETLLKDGRNILRLLFERYMEEPSVRSWISSTPCPDHRIAMIKYFYGQKCLD